MMYTHIVFKQNGLALSWKLGQNSFLGYIQLYIELPGPTMLWLKKG